jgi:hypothetical protein
VLSDQSTFTAINVSYFTFELDLLQRNGVLVGLALLAESPCSGSATVWGYSQAHGRMIQLLKLAVTSEQPVAILLPIENWLFENMHVQFTFDRCDALAEIMSFIAARAETPASPLALSRANSEFYYASVSDAEPANCTVFAAAFVGTYAEVSDRPTRCTKGLRAIVSLSTRWNDPDFVCTSVDIDSKNVGNFLHWLEAMDVAAPASLYPALQPLRALIATRLRGILDYQFVNMAAFNAMPDYLRFAEASRGPSLLLYDGGSYAEDNANSLDAIVDLQRAAVQDRDRYALLHCVQYRYYRAAAGLYPVLLPYYCPAGFALVNRACIEPRTDAHRLTLVVTYLQYASTPSASAIERVIDYVLQFVNPLNNISEAEKWRVAAVLSVAMSTCSTPALRPLLARASDLLAGLGELLCLRPDRVRNVPSISVGTFTAILERSSLIFKEITDQARYVEVQRALSAISNEFNENLVTMQSNILDQISKSTKVANEFIQSNIQALSKNLVDSLSKVEKTIQKTTKDIAAVGLRAQSTNAKILASSLIKEINVCSVSITFLSFPFSVLPHSTDETTRFSTLLSRQPRMQWQDDFSTPRIRSAVKGVTDSLNQFLKKFRISDSLLKLQIISCMFSVGDKGGLRLEKALLPP